MLGLLCEPKATGEVENTIDGFLREGCLVSDGEGHVWIGIGPGRRAACPQSGKLSLYAPDFFLTGTAPWLVYDEWERLRGAELVAGLFNVAIPSARPRWSTSPFSDFETAFDDVQARIRAGTLTKAVPFIERRATLEPSVPQRADLLLHALRRCQGQPLFAYGLWNAQEGIVGTTPEILFEQNPRSNGPSGLTTMALAGTRTPGGGSLLDDPKERTEHRIVVAGIAERLAPFGEVSVGATTEVELPTLVHLHTPIEVAPDRPVTFDEWVAALHPTPAIGAWPKEAGWRWLSEQPNADRRGRYGAPFGFVPPDRETGTCLVAIRNVQWCGSEARLLAGGGIVAASRVDREWREFNAKLDSIAEALGL